MTRQGRSKAVAPRFFFPPNLESTHPMAKSQNAKKQTKKEPQKTPAEKKAAKREKKQRD